MDSAGIQTPFFFVSLAARACAALVGAPSLPIPLLFVWVGLKNRMICVSAVSPFIGPLQERQELCSSVVKGGCLRADSDAAGRGAIGGRACIGDHQPHPGMHPIRKGFCRFSPTSETLVRDLVRNFTHSIVAESFQREISRRRTLKGGHFRTAHGHLNPTLPRVSSTRCFPPRGCLLGSMRRS